MSVNGFIPTFFRLDPPVPYPTNFHRGPRLVNGKEILDRSPLDEWWIGASKETEEKKSADEYWKDIFGMPLNKRLNMGTCKGQTSPDECIGFLIGRINYKNDKLMADQFKKLAVNSLHNSPRVSPAYNKALVNLNKLKSTGRIDHALKLAANIWEMADLVYPKQRDVFIPIFAKCLVLLDLSEDAIELLKQYKRS